MSFMRASKGVPEQKQCLRRNGRILSDLFWGFIILLFFGAGVFTMADAGEPLQEKTEEMVLFAPFPNHVEAAQILRNEKNGQRPCEVCFYGELGGAQITQENYRRRAQVSVIELSGNAELVDWRLKGFAENDHEGCIIDHRTAQTLFGSTAPGGMLRFQGKEYMVREVITLAQKVLYIRPQKESRCCYNRVFVEREGADFLLRNGLSGNCLDHRFVKAVIIFVMLLLPVDVLLTVALKSYIETKRRKGTGRALWAILSMGVLGLGLWWLGSMLQIPGDWIPGQWSDFGFWQKKIQELGENIKIYVMLSKTPAETEWLISCGKTVVFSLAAYIVYLREWRYFRDFDK